MAALLSVWIGLATALLAAAMLVHRPLFSDLAVTLVLWFGSPGAMCLAGLVLWSHRKADSADPGVAAQRLQAKVAIALAIAAAAIVYALVLGADRVGRIAD